MQQNKLLIIIIVIALSAGGYFFWQYTVLNGQLANLKNEKSKVETELAILKATDLAKEAEVLTLKLTAAEKDLTSVQQDLAETEKTKSDLTLDLYRIKGNLAKVQVYLNAIDAMEDVAAQGPNQANIAAVDAKVALLRDDAISSRWQAARAAIDIEKQSWMGGLIADTVRMITLTIGKLTSP